MPFDLPEKFEDNSQQQQQQQWQRVGAATLIPGNLNEKQYFPSSLVTIYDTSERYAVTWFPCPRYIRKMAAVSAGERLKLRDGNVSAVPS